MTDNVTGLDVRRRVADQYRHEDAHERIIPALLHFFGPAATPAT